MKNDDKRKRIIDATLSIMEVRGSEMTNTEIASAAGVNESVIYHYFKNKEDLLFHVAGESLRLRTIELEKQLQGIWEPVSRLTKLIWFQLHYHDDEPEYARFTIFRCRSGKTFLAHPSVNYFIHWFNVLARILNDGIAKGAFSKNIHVTVTAEAILGLLDMENIEFFSRRHGGTPQLDFDEILDLVLTMISADESENRKNRGKRETLLLAAEQVFAEKGFEKATTIEIARTAGVAEGTIYEYFKSKEGLLFSVLREGFQGHVESLGVPFIEKNAAEKLRRFIHDHFVLYLKNHRFAATFISSGIYNEKFYSSPAYPEFQKYLETIDDIFLQGKADGSFRPETNVRIFKNLFLGTFCNLVLRWLYPCSGYNPDIIKFSSEAASLLLRSVISDRS